MAEKRRIEARPLTEAFANEGGGITLKQSDGMSEDQIVVIELGDVETVVKWLHELKAEILDDARSEPSGADE